MTNQINTKRKTKMENQILINGRRLVPINEVAHFLGLGKRSLYNYASMARRGHEIPIPKPKRINSKLLWDAAELQQYVDRLK